MKTLLRSHFGIAVLGLLLIAFPFVLPGSFFIDIGVRICLSSVMVIGLNLLMGYTGQISIGHAGFFGIGAYASGILSATYGWPPAVALIFGVCLASLIAFITAKPILKLQGHYLAMATLGLGIIISMVFTNEIAFTGGPDGMQVPPFSLWGFELRTEYNWYATSASLLVLVTWLSINLIDSPAGRALKAIHGSTTAANVAGIDSTSYKVKIFVLSAALASVSGSLMAHYVGLITPAYAGIFHSIELVTMVVVGGMASIFGSILGVAIILVLPQALSATEGWEIVIFGTILIVIMIFFPSGVLPTIRARFIGARK